MKMRALGWLGTTLLLAGMARAQSTPPQEVQWKSARPVGIVPVKHEAPEPTPMAPAVVDQHPSLPINLATAMELACARPLDVQVASRQVRIAAAQYDRAKFLTLPTIIGGVDYFHHDGAVQNFQGDVINKSRSSFMVGGGANAVFGLNDAIFAPLAARQDLQARKAVLQAVHNDAATSVAEAYFTVQQARGELALARVIVKEAEELVRRTQQLADNLAPPVEATRARVELARRRQAATIQQERWSLASAELVRLLRLESSAIVEPIEPPDLVVTIIEPNFSLDDLIAIGLTARPELAASQAIVQASLQRLRQEKMRPLIPSVLLRSASTNPSGSLAYGAFSGGSGGGGDMRSRFDYDVQVLWEVQNLGLGNKARIEERKAERDIALLEVFRIQDRVAAEVAVAHAQVKSARERLIYSEPAVKDAMESLKKNMDGLAQTRRVGNVLILVVRPQEVVAALQALGQANSDYYAAVADFNRAQFRLYRATGHSAQCLPAAVQK